MLLLLKIDTSVDSKQKGGSNQAWIDDFLPWYENRRWWDIKKKHTLSFSFFSWVHAHKKNVTCYDFYKTVSWPGFIKWINGAVIVIESKLDLTCENLAVCSDFHNFLSMTDHVKSHESCGSPTHLTSLSHEVCILAHFRISSNYICKGV